MLFIVATDARTSRPTRLGPHAMKMGVRQVGALYAQATEFSSGFRYRGSAARAMSTAHFGGGILARPLIPAIRSLASPWISPNTLMVWLTGSTRPSTRVITAG